MLIIFLQGLHQALHHQTVAGEHRPARAGAGCIAGLVAVRAGVQRAGRCAGHRQCARRRAGHAGVRPGNPAEYIGDRNFLGKQQTLGAVAARADVCRVVGGGFRRVWIVQGGIYILFIRMGGKLPCGGVKSGFVPPNPGRLSGRACFVGAQLVAQFL